MIAFKAGLMTLDIIGLGGFYRWFFELRMKNLKYCFQRINLVVWIEVEI